MTGFSHYHPRTHLSISSLVNFGCPRKFFYSSGCRLSRGEHIALTYGSAIHAALPLAFFGKLPEALEAFNSVFEDAVPDEKHNSSTAAGLLLAYHESHSGGRSLYELVSPPSGVLKVDEQVSEYEIPFALDIGLSVPLVGRVDGLCRHRDTGKLWGLEFKTVSEYTWRFLSQYFAGFAMNPQPMGYTVALRGYGIEVEGVIVEALLKSTKKQESLCQPIFVTPSMCRDFITWAQYRGAGILACEARKEFPKDIAKCAPYSEHGVTGFVCDYQPLCLVDDWTSLAHTYETEEERPFRVTSDIKPTEVKP